MGGSVSASPAASSVLVATKAAVAEASLPKTAAGAVAVLLRLAEAIDNIDDDGLNPAGKLDNVSVPTYLRYCEALGLTATVAAAASADQPGGGGASGTASRRKRAAQRRAQAEA